MGDRSGIEWTDATWNPTTGCDKVSPGCENCYALTQAARLKAMGQPRYQRDGDLRTSGPGFGLSMHDDALGQPLRWSRPRRVFVNSMSDLFHRDVDYRFIVKVFAVMALAPQHTFQVLTKRPQRMRALMLDERFHREVHRAATGSPDGHPECLPNVWLGVSVESSDYAWRAEHLRRTPAAVRFVSAEPLLGAVDSLDLAGIDWVIAGGESGRNARPLEPAWARGLRDRCVDASVAFHFKQWGEWLPYEEDVDPPFWIGQDGDVHDAHHWPADLTDHEPTGGWWWPYNPCDAVFKRVGKRAAGRLLDGRTWDEFPGGVAV